MIKSEAEDVENLFKEKMDLNLLAVDAKKYFIGISRAYLIQSKKEKSLAEHLLIFLIMRLQN